MLATSSFLQGGVIDNLDYIEVYNWSTAWNKHTTYVMGKLKKEKTCQ